VTRNALQAERARRGKLAVTLDQRRELKRLSLVAGVEMPHVYSMAEASEAIQKLRDISSGQPALEGFPAQPTVGLMG
jgi:hypothetical protein